MNGTEGWFWVLGGLGIVALYLTKQLLRKNTEPSTDTPLPRKNDENKMKPTQETILMATSGFNLLIQSAADATDSREDNIKDGLLADWMTRDEAIGTIFAYYVFYQYERLYSPMLASSLLLTFCPEDTHEAFLRCYFALCRALNIEKTRDDIVNDKYLPITEIEELARGGKGVGWKEHWCPFYGEFEILWHKGFSNDA